jgi:hypothetical protein
MRTFISPAVVLAWSVCLSLGAPATVTIQSTYTPPTASARALEGIDFRSAVSIDESYRAEFARCDRENIFEGQTMSGFRKCTTDKNRVKALLKFPDRTVFFEAKLSLDIDGSWKACNDAGSADLCPTWFVWDMLPAPQQYVDSEEYPFVVIPISNLRGRSDLKFRDKTGIDKGDIGVAVYKGKVVPVFVADGGPHNKLGEGSAALFTAFGVDKCLLRKDGHCTKYQDNSIPEGVLFFLFPDSKIEGLTPDNALERVRAEALARFEALKHGS